MKSESGFSLAMASQPFQEGAFSGTIIVAASIRQQSRRVRPFQPMRWENAKIAQIFVLIFWAVCKALLTIEVVLIDTLAVAL